MTCLVNTFYGTEVTRKARNLKSGSINKLQNFNLFLGEYKSAGIFPTFRNCSSNIIEILNG